MVGLAVGGVGIAALGMSLVWAAKAQSKSSELSDYSGPWGPEQRQLYDSGETAERRAKISAAFGAGAVVAGGLIYLLSPDAEPSTGLTVGAGAGPTSVAFFRHF